MIVGIFAPGALDQGRRESGGDDRDRADDRDDYLDSHGRSSPRT